MMQKNRRRATGGKPKTKNKNKDEALLTSVRSAVSRNQVRTAEMFVYLRKLYL